MTKRFAPKGEGNQLKLDLQFFAEEEVVRGGYNPDEEINFNPSQVNPLQSANEPTPEPEQTETPGQPESQEPNVPGNPEGSPEQNQQPQDQVFDFAGRQVRANDPESIAQAREDYVQAQRYIQQMSNQYSQLQQQMNTMQQTQQQPQQQQQPQTPQVSSEEFLESFYDDPQGTLKKMQEDAARTAEENIRNQYEPVIRQQKMSQEINGVRSKYSDFDNYREQMSQIVGELGDEQVDKIGLERVYHMAKGFGSSNQPQQPTPEQLMQDPNFVQQLMQNQQFMQQIAQNPNVNNRVIQDYATNKTNQQPPKIMGGNKGASPSLSQEVRPKSISEASTMLKKQWGI